jgi:hypothetical protein
LGFQVDFNEIAKKETLYDEFLSSGMGKEHKKVKFYNTMRYSKNQPYGVEAKILTFDA